MGFTFNKTDDEQATGDTSSNPALQEVKTKYKERKPRSDAGKTRNRKQIQEAELQNAAMEIDAMLSPENMEALVCLPADIGLALTGRDLWKLKEKEVSTLAATSATTAKYFWKHDPKWLALAMFAANFGMVYGTRFVINLREAKAERAEKKKVVAEKFDREAE